jgi:hypothetical protein
MFVLMAIVALAVAEPNWNQGAAWNSWAGHGGAPAPVQDTPEVAAAKAAHFAAVARAGGSPAPAPAHYAPASNYGPAPAWNGAPAPVQDTPEVAAAKAAHFAALNNAASHSSQYAPAHTGTRWTGPIALPPGYDANGAPLPVQDTPEVAAERANHFALVSRGGSPAPAHGQWSGHNSWAAPAPANQWSAPAPQWSAPAANWAAPSHSGLPADTPEVAAAKAAHLAAHQAASGHGHRWRRSLIATSLYQTPASTAPLAHIVTAPIVTSYAAYPTAHLAHSATWSHLW